MAGQKKRAHINNPGCMTKMAAMPIYAKIPSKNLVRSCSTDFNKTWHEALMTQVLQYHVYINHDPVMTLTYMGHICI